jgi:hypothetical protein
MALNLDARRTNVALTISLDLKACAPSPIAKTKQGNRPYIDVHINPSSCRHPGPTNFHEHPATFAILAPSWAFLITGLLDKAWSGSQL